MANNRVHVESVPKIDLEAAKAEYDRGTALFIDVRHREDFEKARIPGTRWLPLLQIVHRVAELPRDRKLIFY